VAAAPLTGPELAETLAAIGGFEHRPLVAVATSGGPDSLALAILADRWARERGGVAWAVAVDHRLRPDSAAEAEQVGRWLAERSIPHAILAWTGPKPEAGVQAAAREARYRLLAEWCRAQGCLHLLTAHHREDQVETHLIRRRARSGASGLAAMPVVREFAGVRLVRPLLAVPRARLAAFLAAEDQKFIDDPSNRNPAFERARLRGDGGAGDEAGLAAALAEIHRRGRERVAHERALDRLIATAVIVHPAGFAALAPGPIAAAADELAEALLGRVATTIGGNRYPPRGVRIARLRAALAAAPGRARTLGGCRFAPWRGRILVMRELAAAAPPARLDPGGSLDWDRRFAAALPGDAGESVSLCYLEPEGVAALDPRCRGAALLPALLHPSLPAFRDSCGRVVAVPHLAYRSPRFRASPRLRFCPAAPLTRAVFTVV
jgi:tRNA(Ile)-lysidine synthase